MIGGSRPANAHSPRRVLGVVAVSALAASFIVTAADRRAPVTVVEGEPLRETIGPGETFDGTWTVTVNRRCRATTRRWLQSLADPEWEVPLPDIDPGFRELPYDMPRTVKYPVTTFTIPAQSPEGEMTYNIEMRFVCWYWGDLLFPIIVIFPPQTFMVARDQKRSSPAGNGESR